MVAETEKRRIPQIEPVIGPAEKKAVMQYLDSGGWITEHKWTREFERNLASYLGCKYVSVVSNGTIALTVALLALKLRVGSRVAVPDYTMIASPNSVLAANLEPHFVDIEPSSFCLAVPELERASLSNSAIMAVDMNGRAADMEALSSLSSEKGIPIIEDAAQALGSRLGDRQMGTLGRVGCLSFSYPKIITTGQGGAVATDDYEVYDRILRLRDFGRPTAGIDYHETLGFNFKFTDLQAVIGIQQLNSIRVRLQSKLRIYKMYSDLLRGVSDVKFLGLQNGQVPWFIDISVSGRRNELIAYLDKHGIGSRPFYPAVHTQPPYAHVKGDFKCSTSISASGLFLPSSPTLEDAEIQRVCDTIREFYAS